MHDKKDIVYYDYIDFDKCKTNKDIKAEKIKTHGGSLRIFILSAYTTP